jgi:hypothetical protein
MNQNAARTGMFAGVGFAGLDAALQLSGFTSRAWAIALLIAAGVLFLPALLEWFRGLWVKRASDKSAAWAKRDRIELLPLACLMSKKPTNCPWGEEPQTSTHRRLKDAVEAGELQVEKLRGHEPNARTLVTREQLRAYGVRSADKELLAVLMKWDALNSTQP